MKVLFQCTYILIKKTLEIMAGLFLFLRVFVFFSQNTVKKTQLDITSGRRFCRPQCGGKPADKNCTSAAYSPHRETP